MNLRDFRKAGHLPTLVCAFLYFDVSFMVWVMLGPLAVQIARDLHLDAALAPPSYVRTSRAGRAAPAVVVGAGSKDAAVTVRTKAH